MSLQKVHEGRNVKRIREILQIKQEVLADSLGVSQQSISLLEQKETIDPAMLEQVAKIMNVPVEAIKNFSDEAAINIIGSTLHDNAGSINYSPTFNPIDKIVELYEALLTSEREKIKLLENILNKK